MTARGFSNGEMCNDPPVDCSERVEGFSQPKPESEDAEERFRVKEDDVLL